MKQTILALVLTALAGVALAQQPSQDELIASRDKKLGGDFFKKATWFTDFAKAKDEAKKSGKPIFGYFTRSYAN